MLDLHNLGVAKGTTVTKLVTDLAISAGAGVAAVGNWFDLIDGAERVVAGALVIVLVAVRILIAWAEHRDRRPR